MYKTKLFRFLRSEPVLSVASFAAAVSCFFNPPSAKYLSYVDFRVLFLLFCLMIVVAALSSTGFFSFLACKVVSRVKTIRGLVFIMTMLCFFTSMLVTNDVSLITFVPFSLTALLYAEKMEYAIYTVVLQTVAANLGSMLTPLGNPQNLFLYAYYKMSAQEFFSITLPISAASLLLLIILTLPIKKETIALGEENDCGCFPGRKLPVYGALFLLCLLSVLHIIPYLAATAIICIVLFLMDKSLFGKVDYALLFTFAAFFIFVGNLSGLEEIRKGLTAFIQGRELLASIALSQCISNVPAAVMLSGFTDKAAALVAGTNIGGLGTLIASLASLISFKLYCRNKEAKPGKYLAVFSAVNFALLPILYMIGNYIL